MSFLKPFRPKAIAASAPTAALAQQDASTETFDHYLFEETVPEHYSGARREAAVQDYEQMRNQLPKSLLGMIPDFVHSHGCDFVFKDGPNGREISGYGHAPKVSSSNRLADGFDKENTDVLVAMGGGSKLVHASRSLGLLVVGGGRLDAHIQSPSVVRLIHSGGGNVLVDNESRGGSRNTMTEFLLNANSFEDVESGVVVIYMGGGDVSLTSEMAHGQARLAHPAPLPLSL